MSSGYRDITDYNAYRDFLHQNLGPQELSPHKVHEKIAQLDLHLQEPRVGCAARTQIITDFLNAGKYVTGRAWVLHIDIEKAKTIEERPRFNAPIQDADGNPLTFREDDKLQGRLTWPWHVAPTAQTQSRNTVVYDYSRFNGPVHAEVWAKAFAGEPVKILFLGQSDAPLYGWSGSCYTPERQEEHKLTADWQEALIELNSIKRMCEEPSFVPPAYRPVDVPRIDELLLTRKW